MKNEEKSIQYTVSSIRNRSKTALYHIYQWSKNSINLSVMHSLSILKPILTYVYSKSKSVFNSLFILSKKEHRINQVTHSNTTFHVKY